MFNMQSLPKSKKSRFPKGESERANKTVFLAQETLPNSNNISNIKYTCVLCSKPLWSQHKQPNSHNDVVLCVHPANSQAHVASFPLFIWVQGLKYWPTSFKSYLKLFFFMKLSVSIQTLINLPILWNTNIINTIYLSIIIQTVIEQLLTVLGAREAKIN